MSIKWQTITKVAGAGSISVICLLTLLFHLAGMNFEFDGDKTCHDCFSEIRVNSTYWEVCVEHAGEKDVVFKKMTRSRRLWVNLDKVDNLVSTNPYVRVEMLVPTIKSYAKYNNEEYGYLRNIKDGDCIIKRRTLARPYASRIILHTLDPIIKDTKWNFDLEHWLIPDINIDPYWLSGFNFRGNLTQNNNVTVEDSIMRLKIADKSSLHCYVANLSDLRITWENSSYIENRSFYKHINVSTDRTVIYVKGTNKTGGIYHWYCNNTNGIPDVSNGYNTFDFFEDASDVTSINRTKWINTTSGNANVTDQGDYFRITSTTNV